jgi:MFS transporter, ACS family, D-galactonate transporter
MDRRYRILALIWLLQFVNYLDRVNISVAAPEMMASLKIDHATFGLVLSAFTVGYAIMQMPGGLLADRFGAKVMLVAAPILWSIFTGLTAFMETAVSLITIRLLFGMAEGSSNAACYKLVGDHFTPRERAGANATWITALALGPAAVAPLASAILQAFGWRHMFMLFAVPGFVLAALLWFGMPSAPRAGAVNDGHRVSLPDLVRRRGALALFFGYMTLNIAFWGFLGWMPGYLAMERHLDLKAIGFAASVPYLFGFVGIVTFGWLGSRALYRYRPALIVAAYCGAGLCLSLASSALSIELCLAGLCGTAFLMYGGFGPYASLVLDLAPEQNRGGFVGLINTGGQIGGIVAPSVIGYAVHVTGSFDRGFDLMVASLGASALCYAWLGWSLRGRSPATWPADPAPPSLMATQPSPSRS